MIKMPSAEEGKSPKIKLSEKKYNSQVPWQQPSLVEFDELKLSAMGSIPGTSASPRKGGSMLWKAKKINWS